MTDGSRVLYYTAFRETLLDTVAEYANVHLDEKQREAFLTWCHDKVKDNPLISVLPDGESFVDQE